MILTQDDEDTCDINDTLNEVGNYDKFIDHQLLKSLVTTFH